MLCCSRAIELDDLAWLRPGLSLRGTIGGDVEEHLIAVHDLRPACVGLAPMHGPLPVERDELAYECHGTASGGVLPAVRARALLTPGMRMQLRCERLHRSGRRDR